MYVSESLQLSLEEEKNRKFINWRSEATPLEKPAIFAHTFTSGLSDNRLYQPHLSDPCVESLSLIACNFHDLSNTWLIQHTYGEQMSSDKPEPKHTATTYVRKTW